MAKDGRPSRPRMPLRSDLSDRVSAGRCGPGHRPLAEGAVRAPEQPEVNATAVEVVAAAGQPAHHVATPQLGNADRALATGGLVLGQLACCRQCLDFRRRQAVAGPRPGAARERRIARDLAHLPPPRAHVVVLQVPQLAFRAPHTALEYPSCGTQRGVDDDPSVAEGKPQSGEPEVCIRRHALGSLAHDSAEPSGAEDRPNGEAWQRHRPNESRGGARHQVLLSEVQEKVAGGVAFSGRACCSGQSARNVGEAEDHD
mmetsp:Transcript_110752/g.319993  ORF Transcript_110752/g.319993 Transcript_110752/m.319993 type:complete len:257 (-) Transcript_110752:242-1012(-)